MIYYIVIIGILAIVLIGLAVMIYKTKDNVTLIKLDKENTPNGKDKDKEKE